MNHIVLGLGFGDEGKGSVTSYLCNRAINPLVIRFNGGHQAGHTVVTEDGTRHEFQSFGSGTLAGAPTFWSSYCTFFPIGFFREYKKLLALGVTPKIYIDPLAPVTTVYDVLYNQALETKRKGINKHGSVGVGIGTTYARQETPYKLYFKDLFFGDQLLIHKFEAIRKYYDNKAKDEQIETYFESDFIKAENLFYEAVNFIRGLNNLLCSEENIFSDRFNFEKFIFEGAQGILLDMDHGFFPYVTRSKTTSANAIEMIKRNPKLKGYPVIKHYVTRAYATRHGAGPMLHENVIDHLKENLVDKTNGYNVWQETLRRGCLSIEMLQYALFTDALCFPLAHQKLYISCIDETNLFESGKIRVYDEKGTARDLFISCLAFKLCIPSINCFTSDSPEGKFVPITQEDIV